MKLWSPIRVALWVTPLAWLWYRLIDQLRVEWTVNPQYTYGWAVPVLCVYLIWRRMRGRGTAGPRDNITTDHVTTGPRDSVGPALRWSRCLVVPWTCSLAVPWSLCLAAFLYLPTRLIQEANPEWRLVSWALALEVIGITLAFLTLWPVVGSPWSRSSWSRGLLFPVFFFLVSVPWPTFVEAPVTQGLMRANVGVTVGLLGVLGVPAIPHGNVIEVATGMVGVDDACSGIRSLQATLMIALFLGELYRLSVRRRVACVVAGFALSFVFNVGRTTLLTWVAAHKGIGAIAAWHDPAGVTILVGCFLGLWGIARALRKVESRKQKVESGGGAGGKAETLKAEMLKGDRAKADTAKADPPSLGASSLAKATAGRVGATGMLKAETLKTGSRGQQPQASGFSFSTFQLFSVSLLVWLLVVEGGTELWYGFHEWGVPKAAAWQVEFPRGNSTFREVPFSDKTRQFLRYDEGENGTWQEGADQRWEAIFLRWNPGRIAARLATSHTPEVCLTAAGHEMVSQSELHTIRVAGLDLPFRSYTFTAGNGPLHVFYCLWKDRAEAQSFQTTSMTYASRFGPVLAGCRNSGQRSLEVAVWGIAGQAEAEAALGRELRKLIQVGPRIGAN